MTPVTYTATFDGLEGDNPVRATFTKHTKSPGGMSRPLHNSTPIHDPKVLAAAQAAKPGDQVRVKEVTDWEKAGLPNWIEEFEILKAA